MNRQTLIIDADDTLWENNIYFERAFARFVDFLDHSDLTGAQIRTILDEIELINIRVHGYGSLNFGRNLQQCYQHLVQRRIEDSDLIQVMRFAEEIIEHPIEMIDGVKETLAYLAERHDLTLFTMGHPEEQQLKVDRSGLDAYFQRIRIVKDKTAPEYRRLVETENWDCSRTWMIGNSPKSDINPALECGINAVLVPHPHTWHLANCDVASGPGRFVQVASFRDLQTIF